MIVNVTSSPFLLFFLLPTVLFVYCMVVSIEARKAVFRLPGIVLRNLLAGVTTRFSTTTLGVESGTRTQRSGGVWTDRRGSRRDKGSNHFDGSYTSGDSLHSPRDTTLSSKGLLTLHSPRRFSALRDSSQTHSPLGTRLFQTYTRPRPRIIDSTNIMFKKAVENHNAGCSQKSAASMQHFFSSSPPFATSAVSSKPAAAQSRMPLENGNGNAQKNKSWSTMQHAGIKRTSSGLEKALAPDNAFEDALYPSLGAANNKPSGEVYFDENDFDSDIDLDIEDPITKGQVKYPNLPPPAAPASKLNMRPTQPRQASVATNDSGYHTQLSNAQVEALHSDDALPWSSSPVEHFRPPPGAKAKTPVWKQYAYNNGAPPQKSPEQARPSKRRTLPWLQQKAEEPAEPEPPRRQTTFNTQSITGAFTPLPKNTKKTAHPWNITASAIKDQQKQLRQKNAKLMKTNEATEEDKAAAIAKKKKSQVHKVFLSDEQQHVLNLVVEQKKSCFFTGSAGTGKSVLLREIISSLRKKYTRETDRVAVTASTGLAACNVGGVTLHSFAGIGLGKEEVPELVKKIRRNQKAKHRWMRTKVLVIDEVSMVDGELFDKLEEIARLLRNNGRPFGGIQLVITGDFFQLPPVPDGRRADGKQRDSQFAFEAGTWNTCIEHTIGLHHVFRQKDPEFANMLNEMREGKLSQQSIAKFRTLNRELNFEDMLTATELFPTRAEVDNANNLRMRQLQGEVKTFEAKDTGTVTEKQYRDKLLANCMAVECLTLKKGAQVMLIKNIDETLVNGSLGKIIGFMSEQMFDNYQEHEEEYYAAQNEGGIREENEDEVPGLKERRQKMKDLMASTTQHFPVVRFTIADGSTRDLLCQREAWKVELPNGEVQAQRAQIPLILAWALSIHKAQGQTLERVKVDLGRVFEKGQAYVALSRAVSMQGLQILNFNPSKVVAHERVRTFYNGLSRAEELIKENGAKVKSTVDKKKPRPRTSNAEDYEKRFLEDEWEV